jgi:hypothetical protein
MSVIVDVDGVGSADEGAMSIVSGRHLDDSLVLAQMPLVMGKRSLLIGIVPYHVTISKF